MKQFFTDTTHSSFFLFGCFFLPFFQDQQPLTSVMPAGSLLLSFRKVVEKRVLRAFVPVTDTHSAYNLDG